VGVKVFEKYTMGCHLGYKFGELNVGIPPSWERTAPTPNAEASVCR